MFLKRRLKRFRGLAHQYRVWRDSRFERVEPQPTPFGFLLSGQRDMMAGTFEQDETRLVRSLVREADVFVDVGANIGYYVCHALQSNPSCNVIAVEPLPGNLRYLLRNVKANGWESRCEIMPVAASAGPAIVSLFGAGTGASLVRGWNGAPDSSALLVPANSLENILAERFPGRRCLIMIDVEGHEGAVMAGARSLLGRTPKPIWFVEISLGEHLGHESANNSFGEVFRVFFDAGYVAWACSSSPREVSKGDVDKAAGGAITLGTHNFLFTDPQLDVSGIAAFGGRLE
jgi:FkbM family methyltransferase